MYAEERNRVLRPLNICAECGGDLLMSRSGHYFCADPRCKDGFDVRPGLRLVTLTSFLRDDNKAAMKKLRTKRLQALTERNPKERAALLRLVDKEEASLIPAKTGKK